MSDISIRIYESVKGDPTAIQSLAAAIAQHDTASVGAILATKGVVLTAPEIDSVMSAASGDGQANLTLTLTLT